MPDNGKQKIVQSIFPFISLLGFSALWYSPFVVSLATAICGITVLFFLPKKLSASYKWIVYSSYFILLLALIDFLFHLSDAAVSAKFLLVLGMVFILRAHFYYLKNIASQGRLYYFLAICFIVTLINVISISGYFLDKAYYDAMLLQSKSIPIPNMHHIHFGVINALIILGAFGVLIKPKVATVLKYAFAFFGVVSLVSFHILSSRTGLLAFYAGSLVTLLVYVVHSKNFKVLGIGLTSIILLAALGYSFSSSLQNKVANSAEDINSWGNGDEINHKSMAMRIEAYKMSAAVLFEHPFGVGVSSQDKELQEMYVKQNTLLYKENRVGPHNQLLEYGVKYGWVGIVGILFFLLGWIKLLPQTSAFFWGVVVVFLVSLQFESLLERQASIYFSMVLLPLFYHLFSERQLIE